MSITKRHARNVAVLSLSALVLAAGAARTARADDDDKKLLSKKPAVIAQPFHNNHPDPWKLASRLPAIPDAGDTTFPKRNMILNSWLPLNNFSGFTAGSNGADCWGYTSPSGREYALMGLSWGNGIVEVTDPANPVIITVIPGGVNVLWRDIAVVGTYAYAVSDSQGVGIQVIDLANIDAGQVTLVRNYAQGGHTTTHSLLQNQTSGFIYACGGNVASGGFKPINLSPDPTFPTFTGVNFTTSYVHETLVDTYTSGPYAGREIAFLFRGSSSSGRISILDVTNKANLVTMSTITYPGQNYSHQGWLSPDKRYLYHNDEIDGPTQNVPRMLTRVFDVQDLAAPRLVSVFTNGLPSVDHNEYTKGRYLYQSNYTTGLHVWDCTNPLKPVEMASLDTRPEDDGTGYNGAWGNFPYFNSGTVLISDIERGLFMTKLSLLEPGITGAVPTTLVPGQATPIAVHVNSVNAAAASVNLRVSVNGGAYSTVALAPQGNGDYSGGIPAAAAFDRVRFYVEAITNDAPARTFTWPLNAGTGDVFTAYAQTGQTTVFSDSFQNNLLWTVSGNATAGAWTRVAPIYIGGPGAVIGDADGSGMCFVTGNDLNVDVDGGSTVLLSPALDLSAAPEARISYSRWFCSLVGTVDSLVTEVSNNNGGTWTQVHTVSPASGGWQTLTFRVADFVAPSAQVRIRFTVADGDTSTTEAGIDNVTVVSPLGGQVCYANCDGSTAAPILTVADFSCFLNSFAAGESYANCDGSTAVPVLNVADFSCFLNSFAAGCP